MLSVGSAYRMDTLLTYIRRTQEQMGLLEAQVATGKQAQSFATQQEPVKLINLKAALASNEQYLNNGLNAGTRLTIADKAIDNVETVGADLRKHLQLMLSPSYDATDAATLQTLAIGSMQNVIASLNTRGDDGYVFGGLDSSRPPVDFGRDIDDPSWKAIDASGLAAPYDTLSLPHPYPAGLGDLGAGYFYFLDGNYAMDPADFQYPPQHNTPPTSNDTAQLLHLYHTQYYKGDLGVSYGDTGPNFSIDNPGAMTVVMDPDDWAAARNIPATASYTVNAVENPPASGTFDVTIDDGTVTSAVVSVDTSVAGDGQNLVFTLAGAGPGGTDTQIRIDVEGMTAGGGPYASTMEALGFRPGTAGVSDPGLRVRVDSAATVPIGFSAAESGFEKLMLGMHILALKDLPEDTEDPAFDVVNSPGPPANMAVSINADDVGSAKNIPTKATYFVRAEEDAASPGNFFITVTDDLGGTSNTIRVPAGGTNDLVFEMDGGDGDGARLRLDIAGPIQTGDTSTIHAARLKPRLDIDPSGTGTLGIAVDNADLARAAGLPHNATLTVTSTAGTLPGTVRVTVTDESTGLSGFIDDIDPLVPADLQDRLFVIPGAGVAGADLELRLDLAGSLAAGQSTTIEALQPPDHDEQVRLYKGWIEKAHTLIDEGVEEIREIRTRSTSALLQVDIARQRLEDMQIAQQKLLDNYEAADTATAIVSRQQLELQLQSSYEVTSRISRLTLVNFLP